MKKTLLEMENPAVFRLFTKMHGSVNYSENKISYVVDFDGRKIETYLWEIMDKSEVMQTDRLNTYPDYYIKMEILREKSSRMFYFKKLKL